MQQVSTGIFPSGICFNSVCVCVCVFIYIKDHASIHNLRVKVFEVLCFATCNLRNNFVTEHHALEGVEFSETCTPYTYFSVQKRASVRGNLYMFIISIAYMDLSGPLAYWYTGAWEGI